MHSVGAWHIPEFSQRQIQVGTWSLICEHTSSQNMLHSKAQWTVWVTARKVLVASYFRQLFSFFPCWWGNNISPIEIDDIYGRPISSSVQKVLSKTGNGLHISVSYVIHKDTPWVIEKRWVEIF